MLILGSDICGVQEARTPSGTAAAGPFWRCSSGCDSSGNFGNELWVNVEKSFAVSGHQRVTFHVDHVLVLHSEPTVLLVRLTNAVVDWRIAVLHAPHRAHAYDKRMLWWHRVQKLCLSHGPGQDWFLLADSNARVGSCTSSHIGPHHADEEDESGSLFHDCLRCLEVSLPATFPEVTWGSGFTLVQKRNGSLARCDFVGVPGRLMRSQLQAWVEPSVSAGHGHLDHFACVVRIGFSCVCKVEGTRLRPKRIDAEALRNPANADSISSIIRSAPQLDWSVSAHEHAALITEHLYQGLIAAFPLAPKRMRRACFTEASGCVHKSLAAARGRLRRRKVALRNAYLRCVLLVWRSCGSHTSFEPLFTGSWLSCLRVHIAIDIHDIGRLARQLRKSCRSDKRSFIQSLVDDLQEADDPGVYAAFRRLVKPPKYKRKGMAPLPQLRWDDGSFCKTADDVKDRWLQHFSALECGSVVSAEELVQRCIESQASRGQRLLVSASELRSCGRFQKRSKSAGPWTGPFAPGGWPPIRVPYGFDLVARGLEDFLPELQASRPQRWHAVQVGQAGWGSYPLFLEPRGALATGSCEGLSAGYP